MSVRVAQELLRKEHERMGLRSPKRRRRTEKSKRTSRHKNSKSRSAATGGGAALPQVDDNLPDSGSPYHYSDAVNDEPAGYGDTSSSEIPLAPHAATNFGQYLERLLHQDSASDDSISDDDESESEYDSDTASSIDIEDCLLPTALDTMTENGLSLEDRLREAFESEAATLSTSYAMMLIQLLRTIQLKSCLSRISHFCVLSH